MQATNSKRNSKQLQDRKGAFTRYEGSLGDTVEADKKQHQQDETGPPERV